MMNCFDDNGIKIVSVILSIRMMHPFNASIFKFIHKNTKDSQKSMGSKYIGK